jgi:glutamate/tyrosine decarboxylase-like PLP-dependent enzyme
VPPETSDPIHGAAEIKDVIELIAEEARQYLATVDERPVRTDAALEIGDRFSGPLPEEGYGAVAALRKLTEEGIEGAVTSAGPRFFHYVIGGTTPAAMGADWLATVLDQNAGGWEASPLGTDLEEIAVEWLKELFELPPEWSGILTTGATMANYTGLMAARQWWGHRHGVDVATHGMAGLPQIPLLTSGYIHISATKALGMLGVGRSQIRKFARDDVGRIDLEGLEAALRELDGGPAIIVANAGEVNAGDFDPIDEMADLAETYGAWLHVDGAFGLFARLASATKHLGAGIERADSVISDGHKWLNVPYDSGFVFVRDRQLLYESFTAVADYLPPADSPHPVFAYLGPEMSRRARALPVWATLAAYGRSGHRSLVERNLAQAQLLKELVDDAPDLERLAEVPLNIVCFRHHRIGVDEAVLDDLNSRLGKAILEDGRVFAGTTTYGGKVALRPAIVNWMTTDDDIRLLVDVTRELAAGLGASSPESGETAR